MTVNRTGHCYLELVDVDPSSKEVLARARATIWSYSFRMLRPYFETTTGQSFTQGIKILVSVKVEYHPVYGMSLNIRDIDPRITSYNVCYTKLLRLIVDNNVALSPDHRQYV